MRKFASEQSADDGIGLVGSVRSVAGNGRIRRWSLQDRQGAIRNAGCTIRNVLVLVLVGVTGCNSGPADEGRTAEAAATPASVPTETAMNDESIKILQTSKDPKELSPAACELARSEDKKDQETLLKFLRSSDFLYRLDTPEDYADTGARPRVGRVLKMLRDNKSAPARETLLALTKDAIFLKEMARVDELIRATETIRPAPPDLVKFWDRYSQPLDSFAPNTVDVLCENASRPALDLLEKKLADGAHDEDERTSWMRTSILPRRNSLAIIECAERMLTKSLPESLRPALVEVLFDYKPDDWFPPPVTITPPDRSHLGPSGRVALLRVADYVLKNVKLTDEQREAVEKVVKQLEGR